MAGTLPTLQKTWQPGQEITSPVTGNSTNDQNTFVYLLITALIAMGWKTVGSSNGTTAGMDAVNRITSGATFNNAAGSGKYTWWVGQNGSGAQALWYNIGDAFGGSGMRVAFAPGGGYTGGSTTALPTATTGFQDGFVAGESLGTSDAVLTGLVMVSADVTCTRVAFLKGTACFGFLAFETASQPKSPWGGNFQMSYMPGTATASGLLANFQHGTGANHVYSYALSAQVNLRIISESTGNANWNDNVTGTNALTGLYDLSAVSGLGNCDDTGKKGKYGEIVDMFVVSTGFASGSTAPLSGTKQFIIVGELFLPWGGPAVGSDVGDFDAIACACPSPPAPTPVLTEITRGPNPNVGTDFGIDVDALTDVPLDWVLCSGPRNLGNALGRRLRTVLGALASDPNYGFDLRDMLNAGVDQSRMGALRGQIIAEIEKDPRVDSVTTLDFLFNASTQQFSINLEVQTATGPFTLIVPVGTP